MGKKILIIEDEKQLARFVSLELEHEGYSVETRHDGRSGLEAAMTQEWDMILLDLMLPELDGFEVARRLRNEKQTPITIMTARDSTMDKVAGLDIGADDYVVKPFDLVELLARIRAVTRRSTVSKDTVMMSNGALTLDPVTHEVKVKDETGNETVQPLTSREYALLEALLRRPGAVLSREAIEDKIYAFGEEVESNAVEFIIHNLRKKVGAANIKNVRGVGWKVVKGN